MTDLDNCGACGNVCKPARANGRCVQGVCEVASCQAGYSDCDKKAENGCEVNVLGTDSTNCGSCGKRCAYEHGHGACSGGTCELVSCESGYADCDGIASNGCEVALYGSDANNCGKCKNVCAFAHAAGECQQGVCKLGACAGGFSDCDGAAGNGCEVDRASDALNCGSCGYKCRTAGEQVFATTVRSSQCRRSTCWYTGELSVVCPGVYPFSSGNLPTAHLWDAYENCVFQCDAGRWNCNSASNGYDPGDGCESTTKSSDACIDKVYPPERMFTVP